MKEIWTLDGEPIYLECVYADFISFIKSFSEADVDYEAFKGGLVEH